MKKKSRREFLSDTGKMTLMLGAFETIFESLFASQFNSAFAAGGSYKSFLHVNMYLSPPRWMYDMVLNPNNVASDFMANAMVKNKFVVGTGANSGRYVDAGAYNIVKSPHSDIYMPYLASLQVPKSSGGTRPVWNMMQNMIQIRGIDVMNAGHTGANQLHQAAVPGSMTLSSVTADNSQTYAGDPVKNVIRAIVLNGVATSLFKSGKGYTSFRYDVRSTGNSLSEIFASLQPLANVPGVSAGFLQNKAKLQYQIEDAMKALSPEAAEYNAAMVDSANGAMKILSDATITTFADLTTDWNALFGKYLGLMNTVLATKYPGINDKPVGTTALTSLTAAAKLPYQYGLGAPGAYAFNRDSDGVTDLRLILQSANLDQLAAQFAVVEFLMTRGICPSVTVTPQALANISLQDYPAAAVSKRPMITDQHYIGYMPGILTNSMFYLGLSTCMLELIDALKGVSSTGGTLFDNTLMYMASEFNRAPRMDGSGSDHGASAAHVNLISGKIANFKLIGNIYKNASAHGYSATYPGTWGVAAPIPGLGETLKIKEVWGSVMNLLGASDIPNAVRKDKLIFNTPGTPTVSSIYNGPAKNDVG